MTDRTRPPLLPTVLLIAGLVLAAQLAWPPPAVHATGLGQRVRHQLAPGGSTRLTLPDVDVTFAIPAGEGRSIGTLIVTERATSGDPPASQAPGQAPPAPQGGQPEPLAELLLERDGSLEETWAEDFDGDGRTDLLLVLRSAGSGGYLNLTLLHGGPEGFDPEPLPGIGSARFPGYMGHGRVEVIDGVIELEFPVYGDHLALADDPLGTLARGELPVSLEDDSNADPTDGTRRVRYDLAAGAWR